MNFMTIISIKNKYDYISKMTKIKDKEEEEEKESIINRLLTKQEIKEKRKKRY